MVKAFIVLASKSGPLLYHIKEVMFYTGETQKRIVFCDFCDLFGRTFARCLAYLCPLHPARTQVFPAPLRPTLFYSAPAISRMIAWKPAKLQGPCRSLEGRSLWQNRLLKS